jgi:hypothetical protein
MLSVHLVLLLEGRLWIEDGFHRRLDLDILWIVSGLPVIRE